MEMPGGVHVQGRPRLRASSTTRSPRCSREMDSTAIRVMMLGHPRRTPTRRSARARSIPDRFVGLVDIDPNTGMESVRKLDAASCARSTSAPRTCAAPGCIPQVPINDKKMYPIYAKCVELDIPIMRVRRRARAARADEPAGRRRCIDEVCWYFPELKIVDAPRRRAVDRRSTVKLHAQVAEPLLLDQRVRAEALPGGHHRLRQHPRRRQDHLRGLLPDGPGPRPDLHRAAERAVPRPRLAQVPPRERDRVFKLEDRADDRQLGVRRGARRAASIDTSVGMPEVARGDVRVLRLHPGPGRGRGVEER